MIAVFNGLKPKLLGLLPSLEICRTIAATALVTFMVVTIAQVLLASSKIEIAKSQSSAIVGTDEIIHRLNLIEGNSALCVDEVQALRKDWKTPKATGAKAK